MKRRRLLLRILSYIFLTISSFIMIYPVLYMALATFTTNDRFLDTLLLPIPNTLNLGLFARALNAVWDSYLFTFARATFYVVINLLVGLMGGYILSKLRFPGRDKVYLLFLAGLVMPNILMVVPQYLQMAWFPLAGGNNIWGRGGHGFIWEWPVLFLYGWVPPFAIFMFKQSFDMLPSEYEDAAKMDGGGLFTIIFRVYGPLLIPTIVVITTITFLWVWNDYLWPSLTYNANWDFAPITLRVQGIGLSGGGNYPAMFIRVFMAAWPPALVYFLLQRYFIQGLVASGLKG